MSLKPMLASPAGAIRFPVFASAKIDGIRALVKDGVVLSRSLKPIPNTFVQNLFGLEAYEGLDGELVVGAPNDAHCMQHTTSGVMSRAGEPDVKFFVFDSWHQEAQTKYVDRAYDVKARVSWSARVQWVTQELLTTPAELDEFEARILEAGYEGVMLRDPYSPYKFGRSTAKEGYLLKVKRFVDSEAIVLGVQELMKNVNALSSDELGHAKRSSHKAGLVPMDTLGALLVRDLKTGAEFSIGGGFTAAQRALFWANRANLPGKIVTYKHFLVGAKDAPRFPVFRSFRSPDDM